MKRKPPVKTLFCLFACIAFICSPQYAKGNEALSIDSWESSVLEARAVDKSYPGVRTADAVRRSVLLRLPGSAAVIAEGVTNTARPGKNACILS